MASETAERFGRIIDLGAAIQRVLDAVSQNRSWFGVRISLVSIRAVESRSAESLLGAIREIAGSHAYGLISETSEIDRCLVFVFSKDRERPSQTVSPLETSRSSASSLSRQRVRRLG